MCAFPLRSAILACCLTSATVLSAQSSPYVDQLISGSTSIAPLRSFDIETRAENRYAIVIGNSDYAAIPDLPNAEADADVMAAFLRGQGYRVQQHVDITKRGFENVLRRILFDVDKDTEVVVFFAGHGFQIGSENYLVPVDADLDTVYDIPFEAVSLGSLVSIIGSRARLQVVILDSCRDNPFAGRAALTQMGTDLREARTGFSSLAAPLNSMLIYSTSPGALAYDGEGKNSPFTAALVNEASAEPDALIKDVFEGVRRLVYQATNGRQVPWDSSTLVEPASFGLSANLLRPLPVSASGGGVTRGLARVANSEEAVATPVDGLPLIGTIDADFVPEVDIGQTLTDVLALNADAEVVIEEGPTTGRLVRTGNDGRVQDVVGEPLSISELAGLVLENESVQIPALSLDRGRIADQITLTVNGVPQKVGLSLVPNQCDFHAGDHLDPDGMGLTRYPNELEPEAALAACQAAVAEAPDEGRFHYQLGRVHVALRQPDAAMAAFSRARELGHSRAWLAIGRATFNNEAEQGGTARRKASDDVLQLYARGVEEGDPYAFFALGHQMMRYGGTNAIEVEGYDLIMRALEVGHTFAMNDLASFYLDEDSEFYDGERGLRYLRESAARNDIYGFNSLGLAYLRGRGGLEPDDAVALELFLRASEGGHPFAPFNVGRMHRDGRTGGGVDMNTAVDWFDIGLQRGHALAGARAAELIATETPSNYDMFDAAVFAAKAASLRNARAVEIALEELSYMSDREIDGGSQKLIAALGGDLTVDGAFGPGSRQAMDDVLARLGAGPAETDPLDRILQLAQLTWEQSSFRVDLY
ncbi:MAG: caspase family protein [Pseudomonadota bacterium]